MTDTLRTSIEKLYEIFAKYQGLSTLKGSPLYENDIENWVKQLRSKKLRNLTEEDLSMFTGKVILTWGDENDFRYYLPRIFELTAELKTPYDIWLLYSRLEDADWKNWDIEEQTAINDFTIELWNDLLSDNSEEAENVFNEYFQAIAYFYMDFTEVLNVWESNNSFSSIKHLTNYILDHGRLFNKNYIDGYKKNTKNITQFKDWLISDKIIHKIEKVFYEYENHEIAERFSWVEQILTNEKKRITDRT